MHLKEFLRVENALGLLLLIFLAAGCSDLNSSATDSSPPLSLSLSSPFRMVEYDATSLLVTDASSNAVHFIDKSTLAPTKSLKVSGRPSGIVFFGDLIYVGNLTTGSVEVLNTDGDFQFYLGGDKGLFQQVNDIAVDVSSGRVYVLDTGAALIRVYNASDGSATGLVIGSGDLVRPTAVEVDPTDGRIFVSEYGPSPAIRVYNSDGSPAIGDPITGAAVGFSMPQGLFIDSGQNLFLAEARTGEIRVADSTNTFVKAIGSRGTGDGELYYPLDVFVDAASNDVFVTDNQNQRIVVYLGGGAIP